MTETKSIIHYYIGLIIFVLVNFAMFFVWKSDVDNKLDDRYTKEQVLNIIEAKHEVLFNRIEKLFLRKLNN